MGVDLPHDVQLVLEAAAELMAEERGMTKGMEKGLEQGLEQGIEQGIEQGRNEAIIENTIRLAQYFGGDIGRAMEALEIPETDRPRILAAAAAE